MEQYHGTTILGVKKGDRTVIAGDGQVSLGNTVIKPNAKKVRRLGEDGKVIAGFAGATADAFTGSPGYMFPRPDGILLGGTFELDEWDPTPEPAMIQRIIASHRRFYSRFRCAA